MRKRYRIGLSLGAAAFSVALVGLLVLLGTASEGPITSTMGVLGSWISGLESRAVRAIRGPGREADLAWFEPLRTSVDSLRDPPALLLGAYTEDVATTLEGIVELEDRLETTFPLIHAYTAWGDEDPHRFPSRWVEAIDAMGSVPVITWEPWLSTFENRLHPHLPLREDRDKDGLESIARGDYDFYLDAWAADAARWGRPLFLRPAHEFNDPYRYPWGPHNNESPDFIAAWRHIVDRFRANGASNVLWLWSPHVAYEGYEQYWPGDEYVDWIATGALNYGTVAYWSEWWTFDQIFGRHHEFLTGFGKPLMIAEFGTLAVGGDQGQWLREALQNLTPWYPGVRALLFFHVENDATVTRQAIDWGFKDDPVVVEAVREGLMGIKGTSAGGSRN
jgi:hypothetical protein